VLADRALPRSESATNFHDAVRETKKQLILAALEQAQGSFTQAAKILGLHPNYLHRLVSNLDLKATVKSAAKR
jgi:transcriptional regulator with GAF, ATPase, and Fis domain